MSSHRVTTTRPEHEPHDRAPSARVAGARLPWIDALAGLLPILLFVWTAATDSANDGAAVPTHPRPEAAPAPAEALLAETAGAGWFGYRDARTGELTSVPPDLFERLAADGRRERASLSAAVVERRLQNGAIEIDLPLELSSPLYGWIDDHGVLQTGHAPPFGADTKDGRSAERRGGR